MTLLGVRIDNFTFQEALNKIRDFLVDGRQHYIVTVNPDFLVRAQKDQDFKNILNLADLSLADGIGVVYGLKLLGKKIPERVSGVDLMAEILKPEAGFKAEIFLLGGKNGVAEKIAKLYQNIKGFTEEPETAVEMINRCQPQILFVALGSPKQEKWIAQNIARIPSVKIAIGVGGAFNFLSGRIRRAPKFLRKIGFEWFWRAFREPWRWRTIVRSVIIFPFLILEYRLKQKE